MSLLVWLLTLEMWIALYVALASRGVPLAVRWPGLVVILVAHYVVTVGLAKR